MIRSLNKTNGPRLAGRRSTSQPPGNSDRARRAAHQTLCVNHVQRKCREEEKNREPALEIRRRGARRRIRPFCCPQLQSEYTVDSSQRLRYGRNGGVLPLRAGAGSCALAPPTRIEPQHEPPFAQTPVAFHAAFRSCRRLFLNKNAHIRDSYSVPLWTATAYKHLRSENLLHNHDRTIDIYCSLFLKKPHM